MSKPPHSSAYPNLGGNAEVLPFPQLIRGINNNSNTNANANSDSNPDPSGVNRRNSGELQSARKNSMSAAPPPAGRQPTGIYAAQYGIHPHTQSQSPFPPQQSNPYLSSSFPMDNKQQRSTSSSSIATASHVQSPETMTSLGPSRLGGSFLVDPNETETGHEDAEDDEDDEISEPEVVAKTKGGKDKAAGGGKGGEIKVKRRRQVQSCSECRRRKIKCDKKFPCGPCVLRNDQSICREVEKHSPTTTGCAPMQEILHLQTRIAALESLLTQSGILDPGALENMLGSKGKLSMIPRSDSHMDSTRPAGSRDEGPIDEVDGESDMEGAALTLEHLAFGRRKTEQAVSSAAFGNTLARPDAIRRDTSAEMRSGETHVTGAMLPFSSGDGRLQTGPQGIGSDRALAVVHKGSFDDAGVAPELMPSGPLNLKVNKGPVRNEVLDALAPSEVFSIFYQRSDVFVKALLSVLPDRQRGEMLVNSYLERVEWLHRCLHVPTFLRQCEDLWNTPLSHVITNVYTPFLSLYFIICCLGLHFMDPEEAAKHFTAEEQEALPEIWLTASRGSLWMGDFTAVHTIENLQNIILVGIFLNNRDRADAAWSLLGAGIKMAQGMGLSRLGAEAEPKPGVEPPKWKAPWESLIKREVGRRLWWNLVFLDWSLAPSYNFASTIHPDQIKTALPANVNDEDLIEGQPLRPRPLSERTSMSYHLARLRFAEISQRQIWQANASPHPPYTFILSVDTELRKANNDLPSYFATDFDSPEAPPTDKKSLIFYWERIIINLSGQSRLMRLHRPWLSRGYKDPKYEYSRLQCIRAARNCLKLMSDNYGTAVFLERWWIPLFYVTVAAVVVMIDLLRTPVPSLDSDESKAKLAEVTKALEQIRQIEHLSHPARGAIKVIDQLMNELDEKRAGTSTTLGKRKAEGDPSTGNGLQRAVKKLILDKHAVSPTTAAARNQTPSVSSAQAYSPSQGIQRTDGPVFDETAHLLGMFEGQSNSEQFGGLSGADSNFFPMNVSNAGMAGAGPSMAAGIRSGLQTPNQSQNEIDFESMLAMYMPSTEFYNNTGNDPNLSGPNTNGDLGFDSNGNIGFGLAGNSNPYRGWIG